jgi:3-phenylpropionate/trans-cinnamate dioxygenase ferredoxin reductase subunit
VTHDSNPLVIVGASYAGLQLAASARELGFEQRIVVVGEEVHTPYQRPPLSKGLLTGKTEVDQLQLRGPDFFKDNHIELVLGRRATDLDAAHRKLTLSDGSVLDYAWLALTTGARCRSFTLPGADLQGVFNLRTLDHALGVLGAAQLSKRACIVGGGFIGLEVAAALRSRNIDVTVVEAQANLLTRAFPSRMSRYVEASHMARGVTLLTGKKLLSLHGKDGRVQAVELTDGGRIECDMVVLGIGVHPNTELAEKAGIAIDNGIVVDALGQTSAPRVLAAGDVANMPLRPSGGGPERMRLESIQSANDGAKAAASKLVGLDSPCTVVPWFWSDQFDLKFQMTGLPIASDEVVFRGEMTADRFSAFYLRNGTLVAAHSVNKPAEHMLSRKLIAARARFTADQLSTNRSI